MTSTEIEIALPVTSWIVKVLLEETKNRQMAVLKLSRLTGSIGQRLFICEIILPKSFSIVK